MMKASNKNGLENEILKWIQKKKRVESTLSPEKRILVKNESEFDRIRSQLEFFVDNAAYLNARRSSGGFLTIKSEADVQDLLFVMLKSSFPSLTFENPSQKVASSFPIKDLYFPLSKVVLEAKFVYTPKDVKSIEKQLHDDIMKYSASDDCDAIIFFIYDPNCSISDRRLFLQKMTQEKGKFMNHGRSIVVTTIIKPS